MTLIEATLDKMALPYDPGVLIGDKAYDSDNHDAMLYETRGIIFVAPNREKRSKTQDCRAAALQAKMAGRASERLAPELPPIGHPL